jgi:hypothetical protein
MVRPAGAVPSRRLETIRGERMMIYSRISGSSSHLKNKCAAAWVSSSLSARSIL